MTEKEEKSELEQILKDRNEGLGKVLKILQFPSPGVHYSASVDYLKNIDDVEVVLPKEDYFLFKATQDNYPFERNHIEGLCRYDSDIVFILGREEKQE